MIPHAPSVEQHSCGDPDLRSRSGFRRLWDLLDRPVFGDHDLLVLDWSDDQLDPIVERLHPHLPGNPTTRMRYAIAACAASLVVGAIVSGSPLRYARAKDYYRLPKRYRPSGKYQTWHYMTTSMNILKEAGLIGHDLGVWTWSKQSVAWANDTLIQLLDPVIDRANPPEHTMAPETIILRDHTDKKEIDYTDTAETERMRIQTNRINSELAKLHVRLYGRKFDIPPVRRIFNGDFTRGGRFYCHGPSFQNIPSEWRAELELVINGTAHPMVEIDYAALHITMAYAEARERLPHGDPYTMRGFDRKLVKIAFNVLLNATTRNLGIAAITDELRIDEELRQAGGLTTQGRTQCRDLAKKVTAAIEARHWRIRTYFGSDCGARFQRQDSDMASQVMLRMIEKTGRCPLPMHDSFLVADIDREVLAQTMAEIATDNHLRLHLKDSHGNQWSATNRGSVTPTAAPPSPLGGKNADLGEQERPQSTRTDVWAPLLAVFGSERLRLTTFRGWTTARGPPTRGPRQVSNVEIHAFDERTITMSGKFELYKDKAGEYRFRLKAGNGEVIAVGEGYKTKASALNGIESVKKNAPDAAVVDVSE